MKFTLVKIGNDAFPASEADIANIEQKLKKLKPNDILVTNHTVSVEVIDDCSKKTIQRR